MQIEYKTRKLERVCTIYEEAEKIHGSRMAEKIHMRIDNITAADTVEVLIAGFVGRCHLLKGTRKNQYAMDLIHPYRLVFEKKGAEIQIVTIIEITDYH